MTTTLLTRSVDHALSVKWDDFLNAGLHASNQGEGPQHNDQQVLDESPVARSEVRLVSPERDQFDDGGEEEDEGRGEQGADQVHEGLQVGHGHRDQNCNGR